jgi:hypothetical protein
MSQNCLPREKWSMYLDKNENLNFKEKTPISTIIEKRHPKFDQSELSTTKVG